jgi:hypothetical protein
MREGRDERERGERRGARREATRAERKEGRGERREVRGGRRDRSETEHFVKNLHLKKQRFVTI